MSIFENLGITKAPWRGSTMNGHYLLAGGDKTKKSMLTCVDSSRSTI